MRKKLDYTRTGHWKTVGIENAAGGREDDQVDATANPSHGKAQVNAGAAAPAGTTAGTAQVPASAAAVNTVHASREASPAGAMEPARDMLAHPISPVRQLLDYTRSGRWALVNEDLARAEKFVRAMEQRARRQARGREQDQALEVLLEIGAENPLQMAGASTLGNSRLAAEEARALAESTFFGFDVKEIPAEKWPEIAPFFPR